MPGGISHPLFTHQSSSVLLTSPASSFALCQKDSMEGSQGYTILLQSLHDLDPETESSADFMFSEYTLVELVLCNLARV